MTKSLICSQLCSFIIPTSKQFKYKASLLGCVNFQHCQHSVNIQFPVLKVVTVSTSNILVSHWILVLKVSNMYNTKFEVTATYYVSVVDFRVSESHNTSIQYERMALTDLDIFILKCLVLIRTLLQYDGFLNKTLTSICCSQLCGWYEMN